ALPISLEFMTRSFTGGDTAFLSGGTQKLPAWLKLSRVGASITGFVSSNGSTWTQVGTTNFPTGTAVFDNVEATALAPLPPAAPTPTPFTGKPTALPGLLLTENFDNGGEGVAYHDTSSGNSGGQYRPTDVDVETSSRGGVDVGWIADGEWLNYSVNVTTSGTYQLQFAVASPYATGKMHAVFGGLSTATVSIPNTGSWQTWTTVTITAGLTAGPQSMKLVFDSGSFNLAGMTAVLNVSP